MSMRIRSNMSDRGIGRLISDSEAEAIKHLVKGGMPVRDALASLSDPNAPPEGDPRHCALCAKRAEAKAHNHEV